MTMVSSPDFMCHSLVEFRVLELAYSGPDVDGFDCTV